MKELRERFFERLNNFKKNSTGESKELVNYRYGELYGLLDSMRILDIVSFEEYLNLMRELDKIYNTMLYKLESRGNKNGKIRKSNGDINKCY